MMGGRGMVGRVAGGGKLGGGLNGGCLWGEARVQSLAIPGLFGDNRRDAGSTLGLVRRSGRRTPCAGRAVILTAVQSLRLLVRWWACWERGGGY